MKPNKEAIVEDILLRLQAAEGFTAARSFICSKYQMNERTFAKYWKIANERFLEELEQRREIRQRIATTEFLTSLEGALATKNDKLRFLEVVFYGKASFPKSFTKDGELRSIAVEPDLEHRLRAIDLHNKMQGDIAPTQGQFSGIIAAGDIDPAKAGKNLNKAFTPEQQALVASLHNPFPKVVEDEEED